MLYNNQYKIHMNELNDDSLNVQLTIDKLVNKIGVTGLLNKVIISNIHFREDIQGKTNLSISDIAYIHNIPVLNEGIEKLMNEFKKAINK